MSLTKNVGFVFGATALLSGAAYAGPDAAANTDDSAKRIQALEARIAELESNSSQSWLTEQRADEIRNIVQDVLADADSRSSLLATGMTAGYDDGAVIGSSDGNWLIKTNLLIQERFIWNHQDSNNGLVDEDRWGFENTRTKFIIGGHVVNPNWFYLVTVNVGNLRAGTGNAYIGYKFNDNWSMQVGSQKAPFLWEELTEAQHQLAVDRTDTNYFFTTGYTDGIQFNYNAEKWRAMGMFSDGANASQGSALSFDTEYAFTGRVEFLAKGNWDQFNDMTSMRGSETGLKFGGAIHYQSTEDIGGGFPQTDTLGLTADVQWEGNGFNVGAALIYFDVDPGAGSGFNPWGFLVQGGYYFNDDWEGFARFEYIDFDSSAPEQEILTFGVNRYFAGHHAKWTTDLGFGIDQITAASALTGSAFDPVDDGQVRIRTQLQILF